MSAYLKELQRKLTTKEITLKLPSSMTNFLQKSSLMIGLSRGKFVRYVVPTWI